MTRELANIIADEAVRLWKENPDLGVKSIDIARELIMDGYSKGN